MSVTQIKPSKSGHYGASVVTGVFTLPSKLHSMNGIEFFVNEDN